MTISYTPLEWENGRLVILDQTRLPQEIKYLEINSCQEAVSAIRKLVIRGAPAIGVAGAYAITMGANSIEARTKDEFFSEYQKVMEAVASARPTARNIFRVIEQMRDIGKDIDDVAAIKKAIEDKARQLHAEEISASITLCNLGEQLIPDNATVLTHCNTGPLAALGDGTALGVIAHAHDGGKQINVYATETRPLLQGARLTIWELKQLGIPYTLITDSMAGHFMSKGLISCVIVGADRIARNGDTANKIGTYTLAVLAKENRVPFYVAAPTTTFDITVPDGSDIKIEERNPEEILTIRGNNIAPDDTPVSNPSFDVTPYRYISAIITEKGILKPPYLAGIAGLFPQKRKHF
ncbi:S-methyl-5-thioribose-1-phosphate isomerase [Chloroflexota bacterium]